MHIFLAILIIFLTPQPGVPERTAVTGFRAASMEECQARLPAAVSIVSQRPGVSYIAAGCFDVVNPKDKAA